MGRAVEAAAAKAGDRAGVTLGNRISRRFKETFSRDVDRDGNFMSRLLGNLFKHNPNAMRALLHPIEATFARPIAGVIGAALLPALAGALAAALSSAVLLALGGGIIAAGAAILVGNEKLRKKVSKQNQTQVRQDTATEIKNMRLALAERLAGMKQAGASDEAIRKVRDAGEAAIRAKQIEGQKKLADAALQTNTNLTQMFTNTGLKIMAILMKAASPLIGPFTRGANRLVKIFESLEPTLHRMFTTAGPILPLLLDTFEALARGILPAINQIMPQIVGMFQILAARAPELADAVAQLLIAMADKKTLEAFGLLLTGFIYSIKILAYLLPRLSDEFISTVRLFETVVHFFQRAPGYIIDAWQNVVQWFKTGWAAVVGFFSRARTQIGVDVDALARVFSGIGDWFGRIIDNIVGYFSVLRDRAGRTVNDTAAEFRALPGKIMRFLASLPGAFVRSLEAALEGGVYIVARGLGTIVEFFVRLPGRIIGQMDALWEGVKRVVAAGITATVSFFATLPARVSTWWNRTWSDVQHTAESWFVKIVSFIATLPGKVVDWFAKTWRGVVSTTQTWFVRIVAAVALLPGLIGVWIAKTWKTALSTTASWFVKIVQFVADLPDRVINALLSLTPKVTKRFGDSWTGAQKTTTDKVKGIVDFISKIAGRVWQALVRLKDRLVDRFAAGWSAATGTSKDKVKGIINLILGIPGRAFNALAKLIPSLAARAKAGWAAFQDRIRTGATNSIAYMMAVPGRIVRGWAGIGTRLRESGRQLLQGFLVGVQARVKEIGGLGGWFKSNLVDPVVNAVKRFFGIHSPSRVFHGIGTNIVAGLWQGIASHNPTKMIGKIFGGMPQALGALIQKGLVNVSSLGAKAMKALGGLWGGIGDLFGGGGRGSGTGGTIGFAANAWRALAAAFGLPMGGWRAHGSVPGSDHPKGKAIDVMTNSPAAHEMIIAFARAMLPGLKYWISNRQIASADYGWRRRPYHGPSPHTDHVHLSFFRQGTHGRGLPEDILGIGTRTGRGFMMHRGEEVLRRNEIRNDHSGLTINGGIHLHVDPRTIEDFQDVVYMLNRLKSTSRMGPRPRAA